jgi:hypothetical protein
MDFNNKAITRGTYKKEVERIVLKGYEISRLITDALLTAGYDISTSSSNVCMGPAEETIIVYKKESR